MTDGLKAKYRDAIIDILVANERVERAVLFGSRAMETFTPASDVDIALFGDNLTLTDQANLAAVIDELPMAQRVDLLLHKTVDNDALRKHIEQHGIEWYRRQTRGEMTGSPWKRMSLGDFVTLQRGHDLPDAIRRPGNKPVLGSFGVTGWHDEARAAGPGVTVGRSGASFGVVSYSPVDYWPLNTALYVVDFHGNDQRFAYYFLKQFDFRTYNSGSAQPSLNRNFIHPIPVNVPPLPEQRAIAHILGTLDDKSKLNRRMNETLAEMARTLFKSWFIDFDPVHAKAALRSHAPNLSPLDWTAERARAYLDGMDSSIAALFPDRFIDSELGEIPDGWEVKRIEDIAERVAMGPFGSSIKVSTFVDEGIPVISGQHLNGTLLSDNEYRFITKEHAEELKKANVQRGDVIFTHAGSIGQVAYVPQTSQFERYVISQRQFYMRCDVSQISPVFVVCFFKTPEGQHKLLANTSSTGVPSISRPVTYLRSIKLCIPPKALSDRFNEIAGDLHLKTGRNTAESRSLTILRDTLLPKLISGEVRIRDAERFLSRKVS